MRLDIDVTRSGNGAYWGKMTATLKNHDGKIMKNDELRIEIKRGKKGWKIVDLKPREFFF